VGQNLYRDLNAEHKCSDTKTRNKIQLAVRTTRWARDLNAQHKSSDTKTNNKIQVGP
jgi:hypothetical protein